MVLKQSVSGGDEGIYNDDPKYKIFGGPRCVVTGGTSQYAANTPIQDRVFTTKMKISAAQTTDVCLGMVVDGHGGWQMAERVYQLLPETLHKALEKMGARSPTSVVPLSEVRLAMERAFETVDEQLLECIQSSLELGFSRTAKCGACACVVLVAGDSLIVANAGDCKAVLSRNGKAMALSVEHNANVPSERAALMAAHPSEVDVVVCKKLWEKQKTPTKLRQYPLWWFGWLGQELCQGSCYVKGRLQPTRSFGDFHLKNPQCAFDKENDKWFVRTPHSYPYISSRPDVYVLPRNVKDNFIVIASDGLWDFLTDQEAVNVVSNHFSGDPKATPQSAAEATISEMLKKAGLTREEVNAIPARQRRSKYDDTSVCVLKLRM
eukprot:CAMPEP_0113846874 /NCGR_PEP_ID=MMETSP0372-20130328/1548_1 /TAXON_ID=340204 /ORGANISM="Lankesteria abbotti" /LENGTH=377 /DNA_ID=CAMNT_0000816063 /DNA_START=118 /DNA_END=1251 /DNA_ORIENTATION=+ /assembly_acc=CAM_ASM_000359